MPNAPLEKEGPTEQSLLHELPQRDWQKQEVGAAVPEEMLRKAAAWERQRSPADFASEAVHASRMPVAEESAR